MIKFKIPPYYSLRGNEKQSPLDVLYSLVEPKPSSVSAVFISRTDAKLLRDAVVKWVLTHKSKYPKKAKDIADAIWLNYGPNETREEVPEGFLLIQE
jgi:hypothetical protein